MNKLWNGTGTPSRGEMYLNQDGQRSVLLDEHNGVLVGELVELYGGDSHPVLSFSELEDIHAIQRSYVERTALDITKDMVELSFANADKAKIEVKTSAYNVKSVVEVLLWSEGKNEPQRVLKNFMWCEAFEPLYRLEHLEARLMNFVFDLEAKAAEEQAA